MEVKSSIRQQEFVALQSQRDADIQRAVAEAVTRYQDQLSSMQSNLQWKDKEHQQSIQKLQDQVRVLELSLAGQATLPSVIPSSSRTSLCQEVFNILLGTVNSRRGAAQYKSQDQAFSFHKQVRFEDNNSSPELRPDVKSGEGRSTLTLPVIAPRLSDISNIPHAPRHASTPYHAIPSNRTFNVSPSAPLVDDSRNAATIVAEVSAAAAAQAWKEFHRMCEPKITKLRGGYSADAELMFRSWKSDILAHINDRELDNKAAIQFIKEQTLDNVHRKVEFQLNLCGGNITYQDLLQHLSIIFQEGDDEANVLAKFYSHRQYSKESEEAFADELQLLARKVISKKPDFRVNLDKTLKQQYANQLLDRSNASIAKTLLLQMPDVSFTQCRNELAQVLGTPQHSGKAVSSKSVSVSEAGAESGEEEQAVSKSQRKREKKISAQSSQIKDLRMKLDRAIAENTQIRELLNPNALQTAFTNALQAAQFRPYGSKGKFHGKKCDPVVAAGKDRTMDLDKTCNYCKDMGHNLDNCIHLEKHQAFLAQQARSWEGLN